MNETAIIILAAGGSRRLGTAKQLLSYQNESLLKRVVSLVLLIENIIPAVVIGARKIQVRNELPDERLEVIENDHWENGLATSITTGLTVLLQKYPRLTACLFVVCDQPYLTSEILRSILVTADTSGKGIVAADYGTTTGTPVCFNKKYFDELLQLQAEEGAKKIINRHLSDLATVSFSLGTIDIDTMDDYKKLIDAT